MAAKKIMAYVDGGIAPKTGMGGAGMCVILREGSSSGDVLHIGHPIPGTPAKPVTNQMAEIIAASKCLEILRDYQIDDATLEIHSDSAYVVNCFKDGWYIGWLQRGWTNYAGQPVANVELWRELLGHVHGVSMRAIEKFGAKPWERQSLAQEDRDMLLRSRREGLKVSFVKVKGHSGVYGNEQADKFATMAKGGQQFLREVGTD